MTHEWLVQEWLERYVGAATNGSDMPKKSKSDPQAVNTYLATLPEAERETLVRLRTFIKEPRGCAA